MLTPVRCHCWHRDPPHPSHVPTCGPGAGERDLSSSSEPMRGGTVCTLLHPNDPPQGQGTHTQMIGGTGCALTAHSWHSFLFSACRPRKGWRRRVSTAPCRSTLRGRALRRDGQAPAYKGERERLCYEFSCLTDSFH